jgi:putative ABC transport system permease protein
MKWKVLGFGVGMAFGTIRAHKLRSFLTVLGVIIGTGTVIAVGSIITGLDSTISGIFRSMGPNTIMVFKFEIGPRVGRLSAEERARKPLTLENARAIQERCPSVKQSTPYLVSPSAFGGIDRARYKGDDIYGFEFAGVEEGYMLDGVSMKQGRFITDVDSRRRLPVAVIGEDMQKTWFPNVDSVGKWIDVNGHQFEVIGTMSRPAASFPGEEDKRVLLPYGTMHKMFPNAKENLLICIARDGKVAAAMDEIRAVLRIERRVPIDKPDNFAMSTPEQMLEQFRGIMAVTAIVMVVISSIGLLVGGIGVMNIMLVSVTERTREIGIRKAMGARRQDIIVQFLTEAVVLTGLGGLLGMMMGWMVSLASKLIFPNLPTAVPLWAAAAGIVVSMGVGLFFGIWPAAKAARLDPVEALRYE